VLSHHGRRPEIALGRIHVGQVVTVHVVEDTITIDLADGDSRTIRRITTQPVRSIKAGLYLPVVQAAPLAIRRPLSAVDCGGFCTWTRSP